MPAYLLEDAIAGYTLDARAKGYSRKMINENGDLGELLSLNLS
jgi:hypothetical protein